MTIPPSLMPLTNTHQPTSGDAMRWRLTERSLEQPVIAVEEVMLAGPIQLVHNIRRDEDTPRDAAEHREPTSHRRRWPRNEQ